MLMEKKISSSIRKRSIKKSLKGKGRSNLDSHWDKTKVEEEGVQI